MALALLTMSSPSLSLQIIGGSEGEAFLKAVEEGDNNAALPMIQEPGSRVVNYKGYGGETALHIVTRKRDTDWVAYLLQKGANPNIGDRNGDTALMLAARSGLEEAANWMVELGAEVDATNRRGETALIIAVQQRQPRLVKLLLEAGASPDKADHSAGYTARDYAKRDTRNPQLLKLIETVKSTKKKAAGPSLN
jgi:ankyrin repeat protein